MKYYKGMWDNRFTYITINKDTTLRYCEDKSYPPIFLYGGIRKYSELDSIVLISKADVLQHIVDSNSLNLIPIQTLFELKSDAL